MKIIFLQLTALLCVIQAHGQALEVKQVLAKAEETYEQANDLYYDGDYHAAEQGFLAVKALYASIGYDTARAFAKTTYKLGDAYRHLRENKRALEVYEETSALYASLPDKGERHLELADVLLDKAAVYSQMYEPERALVYYDSCLLIYKNHYGTNSEAVANALMNGALDLMKVGQYRQAEKRLLEAFEIFKVVSDSTDENFNRIYSNTGYLYRKLGDYDRALVYGKKALEIKLLNYPADHPSVGKYHANLGKVLQLLGRAEDAIPYFQEAHKIALTSFGESHKNAVGALGELADAYAEAGQRKKARELYNQASIYLAEAYPAVHPYRVSHTFNLGMLNEEEGDYAAALSAYRQTLADLRSMKEPPGALIVDAQAQLAHAFLASGRPGKALVQLDSALAEVAPALVGVMQPSAVSSAALLLVESEAKVLDLLAQKAEAFAALATFQDSVYALGTVELAVEVMQRLRKSYPTEEARQYLREESGFLFEFGVAVAQQLYQKTGEPSYLMRALELSSTAKSGQLKDHFRENKARLYAGVSATERAQLDELSNTLRQARLLHDRNRNPASETQLVDALLAYESAEANLRSNYPKYALLAGVNTTHLVEKIQERLQPNSFLLDYVLGENRLNITLVGKHLLDGKSIELPDNFFEQLEQLQAMLTAPSTGGVDEQRRMVSILSSLFELMISPIEGGLTEDATLHVCADGQLLQVPFELLLDATEINDLDYRRLPYFVHKHAISYLGSAGLLLEQSGEEQIRKSYAREVLAVAPAFSAVNGNDQQATTRRASLVPLLNTPLELDHIRQHFGGLYLLGDEANKYAFERNSSTSRILHLATHAHLDDNEPLSSGIYFTDQGDDHKGFLSAAELYGMNLPSQLAVLSACNTGAGRIQTGEGMKSLAYAFLYAGCESVVASRWLANDASTAAINATFYERLSDGVPKDEALRQAKISYLQQADALTAHPFFWAGMGMYGETSPLRHGHFFKTAFRLVIPLLALLGLFMYGLKRPKEF